MYLLNRRAPIQSVKRTARYLMISMYSLSLPLLSLHLRYMTDASTLAGEKVLGSFSKEITLSRMVLKRDVNTMTESEREREIKIEGKKHRKREEEVEGQNRG